MGRWRQITAALLALAAAASLPGCSDRAAGASASASTVIKEVTRGDLIVGLTADGTVALPVTNLNFEVDGTVSVIYVSPGDSVKTGDLLAELDDSDYQLAIQTAENNLDKAKTNHSDAVWQYEQGLKADEINLKNTRQSLDAGFDDYSYINAIADAEAALEKRKTELAETQENFGTSFDSLSSDRQIEDARTLLAARTAELGEAKRNADEPFDSYNYSNTIADAEAAVAKRASELKDAESGAKSPYDSTNIDRQIADAKATLQARQNELDEANANAEAQFDSIEYDRKIADANAILYEKRDAYDDILSGDSLADNYEKNVNTAYTAYISACATLDRLYEDKDGAEKKARGDADAKAATAQKNYDAAAMAVSRLQEDKRSAGSAAATNANDKVAQARQNLADAEKALEQARHGMDKAVSDNAESNAKTLEAAQKNHDSAALSLKRLQQDAARSKDAAEKDATAKLATATQNLADAERSLERALQNYDRAKSDYNSNVNKNESSYQLQLDSYERSKLGSTAVSNAASAVKDAELALKNAKNNLEKIRIYAPIDGEVINISKKTGEKVTANNSGSGGLVMFGTSASGGSFLTICDLSEIYLSASITEGDIIGVKKDQAVKVQIDAIGDEGFSGSVLTVSSLPATDSSGITSYAVTVKLDKTDAAIKDGMAAFLTFVRLEHPDVLIIPNKAVFIEDGRQYVNVSKSGAYEKREVSCGLTNGSETEVLSGLNAGESVVVGAIKA